MIRDQIRALQKQREEALRGMDLRRDVLDKGSIELIDFMGDDDAPVDAARVSFNRKAADYPEHQNDKLFRYLMDHAHKSPTEMMVAKFRVVAPVVVWWHWVRHRMASYNFVSGRYVPFDEDQFYEVAANEWRLQSKDNKQGSDGLLAEHGDDDYDPYCGSHLSMLLRKAIKRGFDDYEFALECGVAREQARLFLPFAACYYPAIVQMNASSLLNFLFLRRGGDAQSEIRAYADAMHSILTETHTRIFP